MTAVFFDQVIVVLSTLREKPSFIRVEIITL